MDHDELTAFRERAERTVAEACVLEELVTDEDGDWPIQVRGVMTYVRAELDPQPHLHLFCRIAANVGEDAWAEINHLNGVMTWGKLVRRSDGDVFVDRRLHAAELSPAVVDHALEALASYATDCGPLLETVFAAPAEPAEKIALATPAVITALPPNGVFVFGSGKAANHSGGAARIARKRFGAERGVSEGPRGRSYAIPTTAGFDVLERAVARFIRFARGRAGLEFYVTRLGCGHAGLDEAKVAALFADTPDNVCKPEGW